MRVATLCTLPKPYFSIGNPFLIPGREVRVIKLWLLPAFIFLCWHRCMRNLFPSACTGDNGLFDSNEVSNFKWIFKSISSLKIFRFQCFPHYAVIALVCVASEINNLVDFTSKIQELHTAKKKRHLETSMNRYRGDVLGLRLMIFVFQPFFMNFIKKIG